MISKKGTAAITYAATTERPPMRATGFTCDALTALVSLRFMDSDLLCAKQIIITRLDSNEIMNTMLISTVKLFSIGSLT